MISWDPVSCDILWFYVKYLIENPPQDKVLYLEIISEERRSLIILEDKTQAFSCDQKKSRYRKLNNPS